MLIKSALPFAPNLEQLVQDLKTYLFEALAIHARLQDWEGVKRLPLHLGQTFEYKRARLEDEALLAVLDKTGQWTPEVLAKQLHQVEQTAGLPVLFVTPAMTAQVRARLVAQKMPFVVTGQQLYLPFQGVYFKERYTTRTQVAERMAYATQAMLIHALLKPAQAAWQPGPMAKVLQYTPMTMTRAFNELEARGLATCKNRGRNRYLEFRAQGRELWDQAKGQMVDPVRKRLWLIHDTQVRSRFGYKAGLSALSDSSALAAPACPVYAVPPAGWNWPGLITGKRDALSYAQSDAIEVEFWAYPPELFAEERTVDPLNLYLSLRDDTDERVQQALEELEAGLW